MMEAELGLSCCSVYSRPIQYQKNKLKVLKSIKECKKLNCSIRVGGELELCGVNCKDSFKETEDLNSNCWQCLSELLNEKYEDDYLLNDILCFISMPISFGLNLYSCVLAIYNREILFISPKEYISDEEKQYFTAYTSPLENGKQREATDKNEGNEEMKNCKIEFLSDRMEKFLLPELIQKTTNQKITYFGKAFIKTNKQVVAHFFIGEFIRRDYASVQKGTWGDMHEIQWDGKRELLMNPQKRKNKGNNKEVQNFFNRLRAEENESNKNIRIFDKDYIHFTINEKINFDEIDILLISGYIHNEVNLFKKYFIEIMNVSKKFPNLIISFNNNTGCDSNFFIYDGFSFIAQGGKVLTKNARFSFSEVQVASVGVIFFDNKKESHQCEAIKGKYNVKDTEDVISIFKIKNDLIAVNQQNKDPKEIEKGEMKKHFKKCTFSFHEDLPISIGNLSEQIEQHLPKNFSWTYYSQQNPLLFTFCKSYHEVDKNIYYQFKEQQVRLHNSYEEISFNCALFLWHILHLTGAKGFVLAISGGVDSAFVACMVFLLSIMIETRLQNFTFDECTGKWKNIAEIEAPQKGMEKQKENMKSNVVAESNADSNTSEYFLKSEDHIFLSKISSLLIEDKNRKHICNKLLNTISLPSQNSSMNTQEYAETLSKAINSYHVSFNIDQLYEFYKNIGETFLQKKMQFKSEGGSTYEDMCLQNIQSRNRMLLTYFFNTLICHKKYMKYNLQNEFLLTLATGNLDESVLGYYTKYDCSSGDISILGNLSKITIKEIICQIGSDPFYNLPVLNKINSYHPSAELKPLEDKQTDENDLQLNYTEIKLLTILKNSFNLGPLAMFYYLSNYLWSHISPNLIVQKIRNFFIRIFKNTHKLFILPPSVINEPFGLINSAYIHHGGTDFQYLEKKLQHGKHEI